jgi:hypothetical protein
VSGNEPPGDIDETWVVRTAALAGLTIPRGHLPAVTATLQRIAELAAPLNDTPLSPADEIAPVWKP